MRAPAYGTRHGFTLVEILVALAVLAVTTFVVSSSLISLARAQSLSNQLNCGALVIRTITARERMSAPAENKAYELAGWTISADWRKAAPGDPVPQWRVWTCSPVSRPSLRMSFCAPSSD